MPRSKVTNSKGFQWGWLVSHCDVPAQSAAALGAGLDIAVHGMNLVELELLAGMFISMLQARPDTLSIARRFGGVYGDMRTACGKFAEVQKAVIGADEFAIAGVVTIDEL